MDASGYVVLGTALGVVVGFCLGMAGQFIHRREGTLRGLPPGGVPPAPPRPDGSYSIRPDKPTTPPDGPPPPPPPGKGAGLDLDVVLNMKPLATRTVRLMPIPRCDTCKVWQPPAPNFTAGLCLHGHRRFGPAGDCRKLVATDADFGCVQWEGKE